MTDAQFYRVYKAQTQRLSFIEALANVGIGFGLSVLINAFVLPLFGLHPTLGDSVGIAGVFTVVSVGRAYGVRRWFNWWDHR